MHRRIYTDGRPWPEDAEPTYAGFSLGKWIDEDGDGKYDVLEVETRFLKNPRGYDTTGIPFHADGKTVIKERIYLDKADRNVLWNDITVIDNALTRPYSKKQRAERNPDPHPTWKSDSCLGIQRPDPIGADNYYLSADGYLMPAQEGPAAAGHLRSERIASWQPPRISENHGEGDQIRDAGAAGKVLSGAHFCEFALRPADIGGGEPIVASQIPHDPTDRRQVPSESGNQLVRRHRCRCNTQNRAGWCSAIEPSGSDLRCYISIR